MRMVPFPYHANRFASQMMVQNLSLPVKQTAKSYQIDGLCNGDSLRQEYNMLITRLPDKQ